MRRLIRPLPIAALLVCAAVVAACGGSTSSNGSVSGTATTARAAGFQKFQQCLKDHGITLPTRRPRAGGYGPPASAGGPPAGGRGDAFRQAAQACRQYAPQGGFRGGGAGRAGGARFFTAYLTCLKRHGAKVDPTQGPRALSTLDRSDPTVRKALNACLSKLPQRPRAGTGTSPQQGAPA